MSRTVCYALDLLDEPAAIAEYERIHRPGGVYPEVIDDLRAQGFKEMTIWRTGNRLLMVVQIEPQESPPVDSATRKVLEGWQVLTESLQQALPGHGARPEWIEMKCVFDLREHHGR